MATATRIRYAARTPDQLRNREVEATSVDTWALSLVAIYETDPGLVGQVLPPPLVPSTPEHVRVTIASVDIPNLPRFGAGTFAVGAEHDGLVGDYALTMPMSTEQSVIGGRETFGEPKKIAEVRLDRPDGELGPGSQISGSFTRMGVTYVEFRGRIVEELAAPPDGVRTSFYLKFQPAPDGKGFDDDPALVHVQRREKTRRLWRLDGELILRESRFDPVADLPVRRLVSVELAERSSVQTGAVVRRLPQEDIIPFAHQRYDDLSPLGED